MRCLVCVVLDRVKTFNESMTWVLGHQRVRSLMVLKVANISYLSWPQHTSRRYLELEVRK